MKPQMSESDGLRRIRVKAGKALRAFRPAFRCSSVAPQSPLLQILPTGTGNGRCDADPVPLPGSGLVAMRHAMSRSRLSSIRLAID
jgi:hypothetical protein